MRETDAPWREAHVKPPGRRFQYAGVANKGTLKVTVLEYFGASSKHKDALSLSGFLRSHVRS